MGACASRPKDLDGPVPVERSGEVPAVTTTPEVAPIIVPAEVVTTSEAVTPSKTKEAKEEPLMDLSTPKAEVKQVESAIESKVEEEIAALQLVEDVKPKEEPSTGSTEEKEVVVEKPKEEKETSEASMNI